MHACKENSSADGILVFHKERDGRDEGAIRKKKKKERDGKEGKGEERRGIFDGRGVGAERKRSKKALGSLG